MESGSASLVQWYETIQSKLVSVMHLCLEHGNEDVASSLDDIALRQKLWARDINLKDGALTIVEETSSIVSKTIRSQFDRLKSELLDLEETLQGVTPE